MRFHSGEGCAGRGQMQKTRPSDVPPCDFVGGSSSASAVFDVAALLDAPYVTAPRI
jgi:hypothetical protein